MNITTCCLLPWCLWTDERLQNLTWLENVSRNLSNTGYFIPAGGSSTPKCIYRAAENMHDQLISCSVPSCADWELGAREGKLVISPGTCEQNKKRGWKKVLELKFHITVATTSQGPFSWRCDPETACIFQPEKHLLFLENSEKASSSSVKNM